MTNIINEAINMFLPTVATDRNSGVIIIGSAADDRFVPGISDIDLIIIAESGDLRRGTCRVDNEYGTIIDYTIGTLQELIANYTVGDGQAFQWLFGSAKIHRENDKGDAQKLINLMLENIRNSKPVAENEPAWRIGITAKCNFDCFFCHKEGLSDNHTAKPDFKQIYRVILHGIRHGCRDFTFTGGEPLLYAADIAKLLKKLAQHPYKPSITIVTNGFYLHPDLIEAAKKYEKMKLNISFHSTEKETFQKIIRRTGSEYERVAQNIITLKENSIKFSLNYVLLRNINNSPARIEAIVDYAKQSGAYALKFLELLVTNDLVDFYDNYCDVRYIEEILKNRITLEREIIRRKEYRLTDSDMLIYVQRCRCRLGCNKCFEGMDRIITPAMDYEPCFTENERTYPLQLEHMDKSFAQGDKMITAMMKKYGDRSPLLVYDPIYSTISSEYFYTTDRAIPEILQQLKSEGYQKERIRKFSETYYRYIDDEKEKSAALLQKSYIDNEFPGKHNFFQAKGSFDPKTNKTTTLFMLANGPQKFSQEELSKYIAQEILTEIISLSWEIYYFSVDGMQLSVGQCSASKQVIVRVADQPLPEKTAAKYQLRPVGKPLLELFTKTSAQ